MLTKFVEGVKSNWKIAVSFFVLAFAGFVAIFRTRSVKPSAIKGLHDSRVKGQLDVVNAELEKENAILEANKAAEAERQKILEEEKREKFELISQDAEDLTKKLSEAYNISNMDRKP